MTRHKHTHHGLRIVMAVLSCLMAALPLLAQYEQWLQEARRAYQAGDYEQCVNNCMIYSSMNASTVKDELQVKAERMLACKAAGTLNAYRYMVQYNPHDTWAQEQLKKTLATGDDHKFCVFFLPGEWDFDGSQSAIINEIAAAIKRDNNIYKLVGYQKYGMASNKLDRTRRVKKALVEKGIAPNRLEDNSFSFGSLAANDDTHFLTEAVIIEKTSETAAATTSTATASAQSLSPAKPTNGIDKIWVEHKKQLPDGVGMVIHGSWPKLPEQAGSVYYGVCFIENHSSQRQPVYSTLTQYSKGKALNKPDVSISANYGNLYKKNYNTCIFFVCNEPKSPFDKDFDNYVLAQCEIPIQDVQIPNDARFAVINSTWIEESNYGRFLYFNYDMVGMEGKKIRFVADRYPKEKGDIFVTSDYSDYTCSEKYAHSDKTPLRISMDNDVKYQNAYIKDMADGTILARIYFSKDRQPEMKKR